MSFISQGGNPQMKTQLEDVRKRINTTRDTIARLSKEHNAAKDAFGNSNSNLPVNEHPDFLRAQNVGRDLAAAQQSLDALKEEEHYYLSKLSNQDTGIFSQSFLENPAVLGELATLSTSSAPVGSMTLGRVTSKENLADQWNQRRSMASGGEVVDYSATGNARTGPFRGIVAQLRRDLTLLDLIATETMDNNVIPYVQETGELNNAAETAEFALKPGGDLTLVDAEARARTIPVWLKAPRQTLNDIGGLANVINNRLLWEVRSRFEIQILSGDGTGENLLGILNTTGIAQVDYVVDTLEADATLDGIVDVILSDAQPNGVVLNPVDWAAMQIAKADSAGTYLSGGPFQATPRVLWGMPVILNKAMPAGQALVGDFNIGVTALIREAPNVRISDSDQDDFLRNKITVLAEGRFAVAVWQPTAFALVQLTDPS